MLLPWLIRNYTLGLGPATLSTAGGLNLWMGNNPDAIHGGFTGAGRRMGRLSEADANAAYRSLAIAWISENPVRYARLCTVRLARLLGLLADPWAARWLWPTEHNDALLSASYRTPRDSLEHEQLRRVLARLQRGHERILSVTNLIFSPLAFVAVFLSLWNLHRYAAVVLPPAVYLAGLSMSFAAPRFRALSDLLLVIPVAALLADLIVGSRTIGGAIRRQTKWLCVAVALGVTVLAWSMGWDRSYYWLSD